MKEKEKRIRHKFFNNDKVMSNIIVDSKVSHEVVPSG